MNITLNCVVCLSLLSSSVFAMKIEEMDVEGAHSQSSLSRGYRRDLSLRPHPSEVSVHPSRSGECDVLTDFSRPTKRRHLLNEVRSSRMVSSLQTPIVYDGMELDSMFEDLDGLPTPLASNASVEGDYPPLFPIDTVTSSVPEVTRLLELCSNSMPARVSENVAGLGGVTPVSDAMDVDTGESNNFISFLYGEKSDIRSPSKVGKHSRKRKRDQVRESQPRDLEMSIVEGSYADYIKKRLIAVRASVDTGAKLVRNKHINWQHPYYERLFLENILNCLQTKSTKCNYKALIEKIKKEKGVSVSYDVIRIARGRFNRKCKKAFKMSQKD